MLLFIRILFASLCITSTFAAKAANLIFNNTPYQVCFTPGQSCTNLIVDSLNQAKQSIAIQAYSFTSAPIAKAIVDAKKRGVTVTVILDKSQCKKGSYSACKFLEHAGIPVWIDYRPAIAHNKVIIIDNKVVITGSFNFTKAAETRNAENLLIIENTELAKIYSSNFHNRFSASMQSNQKI